MQTGNSVLVLGATGGIGGELARQLRDAGWTVRALKRTAAAGAPSRDGITWIRGDALAAGDVAGAAAGCSVIVHAVNPPGYRRWAQWVLPMLDNSIAAARAVGATLVLPGTVYNFGPDAFPVLTESSPQHPHTRKGAIRAEMERRLRGASEHGTRVIILRAGDFFGPGARNNWFAQGLVKPGRPVSSVSSPGRRGVGHQWAYLPDVARTLVMLLERRASLEPFAVYHLQGHWDPDGARMVDSIRHVVARRTGRLPRAAAFPWWLIALGAPVVETFREILEVRHLWQLPLRMDNARLRSLIGAEPHTPWDEAVEATLESLGCLQGGDAEGLRGIVPDGTRPGTTHSGAGG